MTDIDPRSDIGLSYFDANLHVSIPLAGQVNEMWCRRYEALAQAKDVQAVVRGKRDEPPWLHITIYRPGPAAVWSRPCWIPPGR